MKTIKALFLSLILITQCAFPGCSPDAQRRTLQGVLVVYQAAIASGTALKSFHAQGALDDDAYRTALLALRDTRLVLKELTDLIESIPEVDASNSALITTFATRARDALVRLADVGAFGLRNNPAAAEQFRTIVKVGADAALTIFQVISAIKKPTAMPKLPGTVTNPQTMARINLQEWLQTAEVLP